METGADNFNRQMFDFYGKMNRAYMHSIYVLNGSSLDVNLNKKIHRSLFESTYFYKRVSIFGFRQ